MNPRREREPKGLKRPDIACDIFVVVEQVVWSKVRGCVYTCWSGNKRSKERGEVILCPVSNVQLYDWNKLWLKSMYYLRKIFHPTYDCIFGVSDFAQWCTVCRPTDLFFLLIFP